MSHTLGDMLSISANRFSEKNAITFNDQRLSYREIEVRANRIANVMTNLGLKKGDRCAILFFNRVEWAELYFGLAKVGIIAVPINFRFALPEIKYVLKNSNPMAIIFEESFQSIVCELKKTLDYPKHYICLGTSEDLSYTDLLTNASEQPPKTVVIDTDPFFIAYTSGTTGFPKGALITHKSLITHYLIFANQFGKLAKNDRLLLIMPIFHSNSTWFLHALLMIGGSAVIIPSGGFDPEEILSIIDREKVTGMSVVPTMLTMILNLDEKTKRKYNLSSLQKCLVGGAPLMTQTKEQIIELVNNAEFFEGYGSTETGLVTVLNPEDQLRKVRSVGIPTIGKEVRLLDSTGNDVAPGEIGELYVRGLGVLLKEYWQDSNSTSKAFIDEWCTVGDMARFDEEGYLYLEDRKKDMIISGGENIYPTEVENVLAKHTAVLETAVVGVPDELWGERVHAVIKLKDGEYATGQEIIDFCRDKIAGYKRPRSIDFVTELPKSPTGKILRRIIREPYWRNFK